MHTVDQYFSSITYAMRHVPNSMLSYGARRRGRKSSVFNLRLNTGSYGDEEWVIILVDVSSYK